MKWLGSHLVAVLLGAGLAVMGVTAVRSADGRTDSPPDVTHDGGSKAGGSNIERERGESGATRPSSGVPEAGECLCGPQRTMYEALCERALVRAYGRPIRWPADAGIQSPSVVSEVFDDVVDRCGQGIRLDVVDCEEPPCIGVMERAEGDGSAAYRLQTCAGWQETYEGSAAIAMRDVDCDGVTKHLLLMSPPWPSSMLGDVSEDDYQRRLDFRWDVLADEICAE